MASESAFTSIGCVEFSDARQALLNANLQVLSGLIDGIELLSDKAYTSLPGDQKSSIGMHVRHVIEFYQEFLKTLLKEKVFDVCYDNRKRNLDFEISKIKAQLELSAVVRSIQNSDLHDREIEISVIVDPNQPLTRIRTSLHRELYHVLDHTVHHMAIIKMLAFEHNIIFDEQFGLASATQKDRQDNAKS